MCKKIVSIALSKERNKNKIEKENIAIWGILDFEANNQGLTDT